VHVTRIRAGTKIDCAKSQVFNIQKLKPLKQKYDIEFFISKFHNCNVQKNTESPE